MPKVRGGADKWQRRSSQSVADYASGVQQPRRPWHEATAAAADAWRDGIQDAIAQGSFAKAATPEAARTWQQKAATLGQQRYAPGVMAAREAYERGFAPYRSVIENIQLPERGRRGDPGNLQRVVAMASALHEAKRRNR